MFTNKKQHTQQERISIKERFKAESFAKSRFGGQMKALVNFVGGHLSTLNLPVSLLQI